MVGLYLGGLIFGEGGGLIIGGLRYGSKSLHFLANKNIITSINTLMVMGLYTVELIFGGGGLYSEWPKRW